jgi:hypothetical protein
MTGVSGKERRRQDKQEGDEIDVQTAALWWRCVERHQGYYHFVKIVVEGAEKLSAKKCKEPSLFERADIFTVCHGALLIRFRVFVGEILQQCKSKTVVSRSKAVSSCSDLQKGRTKCAEALMPERCSLKNDESH